MARAALLSSFILVLLLVNSPVPARVAINSQPEQPNYSGSSGAVAFEASGADFLGFNITGYPAYYFAVSPDSTITVQATAAANPLCCSENYGGVSSNMNITLWTEGNIHHASSYANGTGQAISTSTSLTLSDPGSYGVVGSIEFNTFCGTIRACPSIWEPEFQLTRMLFIVRPMVTISANVTAVGVPGAVNLSGTVKPDFSVTLMAYKDGVLNFTRDVTPSFSGAYFIVIPFQSADQQGTWTFTAAVFNGNHLPAGQELTASATTTVEVGGVETTTTTTSTTSTRAEGVDVYPTEPAITGIRIDYRGAQVTSPITIRASGDSSYPRELLVSFRTEGSASFQDFVQVNPSAVGISSVEVNATLDCALGCSDLPRTYDLTISASSGGYSQSVTLPLHLLKAKWLVMQYLAADSYPFLEEPMLYNIEEAVNTSRLYDAAGVGTTTLINLAYTAPSVQQYTTTSNGVQTQHTYTITRPRARIWGVASLPADTTQLYRISNGTLKKVGRDWTSASDLNMSDPRTLRKFIDTSMELIPADHYQLIISDHGGGIQGVAWDWHEGDKAMSIPGLLQAFTGLPQKLDVISFDACYMAQLEVLSHLAGFASYFTASERTIPGYGYAYDNFLADLSVNPDMSPREYVTSIVQAYGLRYGGTQSSHNGFGQTNSTLSAIDASKLPALASAVDTLSKSMVAGYRIGGPGFNTTLGLIVEASWRADDRPFTDIGDLARNIAGSNSLTDTATKDAAKSVLSALSAAVVSNAVDYFEQGTSHSTGYSGLTILLWGEPTIPKGAYGAYGGLLGGTSFGASSGWPAFLQAFNGSRSPSQASWVVVVLNHPSHQLYLHLFDGRGRHVGVDFSKVEQTREELDLGIPGTLYLDFHNGTVAVLLSGAVGSLTVVVDGTNMQESSEPYKVKFIAVTNGTASSTVLEQVIGADTLQSAPVQLQNGKISVGTVTTLRAPVRTTTQPGPGPDVTSLFSPLVLAAIAILVVILLAVVAVASRRRSRGKRQVQSVAPPQPQPSVQPAPQPVTPVTPPAPPTAPVASQPSPAPAPVAEKPVLTAYPCRTCGFALYYIPQHRRYYCYNEKKYV